MKYVIVDCARCGGSGKIKRKQGVAYSIPFDLKKKAFELREEGMTLRGIGKEIGMKGPQSVQNMLLSYEHIMEGLE